MGQRASPRGPLDGTGTKRDLALVNERRQYLPSGMVPNRRDFPTVAPAAGHPYVFKLL